MAYAIQSIAKTIPNLEFCLCAVPESGGITRVSGNVKHDRKAHVTGDGVLIGPCRVTEFCVEREVVGLSLVQG